MLYTKTKSLSNFIKLFVRKILRIYSIICTLMNYKDSIINNVKASMYYVLIFFMPHSKKTYFEETYNFELFRVLNAAKTSSLGNYK